MKHAIHKLHQHEHLTIEETEDVMREIISGNAAKEEIAHFLSALRAKGPTVDEITGAAKIMRQFKISIPTRHKRVLDTCGTGGDKKNTFNISTISAFVVAGAGAVVAKHGNRSVSSKCGSACLLEGLGVNLEAEDERLSRCLDEIGIAFLFAQKLHPAMKNVAAVRKELGVETIFNLLGPLTNPANATHQMMGVYDHKYLEPMAQVLRNLGLQRVLVVHGQDGLDEMTTTGQTFVSEFNGRDIINYHISPVELGIPVAELSDLEGGDIAENVATAKEILDGVEGPKRDIVVLNAAYALYTAEMTDNINEAIRLACDSIDRGKAKEKLAALVELTCSG